MDKNFQGRFEAKLDTKGRLAFPAPLRPTAEGSQEFVITNSQYNSEACLDLYTKEQWTLLENKINKMSSLKAEVQAFKRFYLAGGQSFELDSQSRFLIPLSLRKYAGLKSNVVLVGMGHKVELWSRDVWDKLFNSLAQNFEDTLAAVADLDMESA